MKVKLHSSVMLSDFEQRIYNEYLRTSRTAAGKPYKLRKNFDDVDPTTTVYLKRIARILHKFANISPHEFFQAPYTVYGSDEYFDLKFFTSPRALKTYTIFMQQEVDANPDTAKIMQRVLTSLQFIKEFCTTQNCTLMQYTAHTTGDLPTFIMHLKERKLSTYVMLEIPNLLNTLKQQDPEVMKFMFGDNFYNNLNLYKTRYFASTSCKTLVREGLKKIEKTVVSGHTSS